MKNNNQNNNKRTLIWLLIVLAVSACIKLSGNPDSGENTRETIAYLENVGESSLTFRNDKLLEEHYEKHGIEMGFDSPEAYEEAAAAVVANSNALYKTEAEDGDGVYYLEATNEFVIVSTDGYIRTYFNPNDGISYFNRQ